MENTQPDSLGGAGDVSPTGVTASTANAKMRKRTKTGCLTCRKRRIKCGEERPTCGNCIKSKRQCEGYNQRVVFKPPIGDWPNHPGVVSTIQYHTSMLPGTRNQPYRPQESAPPTQDTSLSSLQPRPLNNFDFSSIDPNSGVLGHGVPHMLVGSHDFGHHPGYQQPLQSPIHQQPLHSPHHQIPLSSSASYFPQAPPVEFNNEPRGPYQGSFQYSQTPAYPPNPISYDNHPEIKPAFTQSIPQPPLYSRQYPSNTQPETDTSYHSHSSVSPRSDQYAQYQEPRPGPQRYNSQPQIPSHQLLSGSAGMSQAESYNPPIAVAHADFSHSTFSSAPMTAHELTPDVKYMSQSVSGMSRV